METSYREDGVKTYYAPDRAAWRTWLAEHHATETSVWLIIYRKQSDTLVSTTTKRWMRLCASAGSIASRTDETKKVTSSSFRSAILRVTGVRLTKRRSCGCNENVRTNY